MTYTNLIAMADAVELAESLINGNRGVVRARLRDSADPAEATALLINALVEVFGVEADEAIDDVRKLLSVR